MASPRPRVLAVIMAGGKGERLYPLTKERSKPAVPFGGKYRIVDFVLSNFLQSGVLSMYVLVQYLSQSLIEYLRMSWRGVGLTRDQFITVVPPQMRLGDMWYRGTADAVRQNLNLLMDFNPDIVAVFGADHIYRMDVSQMIQFHMDHEADVTVAALPVPIKKASGLGVIEADSKGRVIGFEEKPKQPKPMPSDKEMAYSSMGNYLFNRDALVKILTHEAEAPSELDFGKSILPRVHKTYRVMAYNFAENELPGIKPYEEKAYWRDVGTIEALWESHMDLLGPRPRFDLNNPQWKILSGRYDGPPAKLFGGQLDDALVGDGCIVKDAKLKRSILGRGVEIGDGCVIEDSILMDFVKVQPGAKLKRVIVDRFNMIPAKESIGHDADKDAQKYYLDPSGIVVLPRGKTQV